MQHLHLGTLTGTTADDHRILGQELAQMLEAGVKFQAVLANVPVTEPPFIFSISSSFCFW